MIKLTQYAQKMILDAYKLSLEENANSYIRQSGYELSQYIKACQRSCKALSMGDCDVYLPETMVPLVHALEGYL